ncbi:MAG: bifunctional 5,10-methylenetetrahydrofolate dehydrogenase/5,10-methenyltetrahydrofolate cyclohydrolase [Actinomycetes bacterium]
MTAILMDGKALAARVREAVAADVRAIGEMALATVLVGADPASEVYIRLKHDAAKEVGITPVDRRLGPETTEAELLAVLAELNADDSIDGILVQTPLPPQIDEIRATDAVAASKDVDGFHPENAGQLYRGRPTLVPATALGVMELLDAYSTQLEGVNVVIVGRSDRVGKPLIHLLLQRNATVTVCHSRTPDLAAHTRGADVLIAAVGRPALITAAMVKPGATVVDVGVNRVASGLVGDVDPGVVEVAGHLSPVPGGVGPMTIACLLQNAMHCARLRGR